MERERGQTQTLNYLSCFCCSSNCACSLVLSSQFCVWCETPFQNSPQNGSHNFWLSSHRHVWCPTACLYIVTSDCQLTLIFCLVHTVLMVFSFGFLPANQNSSIRCWYISVFSLGACCYDDLDFGHLLFSLSLVYTFHICFFLFHHLVVD